MVDQTFFAGKTLNPKAIGRQRPRKDALKSYGALSFELVWNSKSEAVPN